MSGLFLQQPGGGMTQAAADALYLALAGGTMTGALVNSQAIAAATQADGVQLLNSTAATSGNQTWSPSLRLTGNQWASGASRTCEGLLTLVPVEQNYDHSILRIQTKHGSDALINLLDIRNFNGAPYIERGGNITIGSNAGNGTLLLQFNGTPYAALNANAGAGSFVVATGAITIGSGGFYGGLNDLHLVRAAAATLQLGTDHATTPTAQTLVSHSVTTGTGANMIIGAGTGSVAGGAVILATRATTGALQNRLLCAADGSISFPVVTAVTTEAVVSDTTWPVTINGTTYKICLKA